MKITVLMISLMLGSFYAGMEFEHELNSVVECTKK